MSDLYTNPKSWGPHFWYMMRCVAHNYKDNPTRTDKKQVLRFYEDIGNILPCQKCVRHYKQATKKYPCENNVCCRDCLRDWVELIFEQVELQKK